MKKRTVAVCIVSALTAVTLAACAASNASHVVTTTPPAAATTSTTVPSTPSTTAATPPSAALSAQTLDQIGVELGSLDHSLNTADTDLSNPQGDS